MQGNGTVYVSKVLGRQVKNMAGHELGEVKEVTMSKADGRVTYIVIKFGGGFLKSGKLYAVPWDLLQLSKDETCLLLDFDKAMVENIPTFDEHTWPNMSDRHWGKSVYAFFDATPYWEREPERYPEREAVSSGVPAL
jgi:sporulation protein YlmC with PRC-barrel domain